MDISKHSNDNNIGSKKAMKLLLSVSAFSIMFSYSSLLFPALINSLSNVYVSAFSNQSFSSTLEKNCVFLLFNGLLVIIVMNSGLIGKSPELNPGNSIVLNSTPEKASPLALQHVLEDDEEDEKKGRDQTGKLLVTLGREEEEEVEEEVSEEVKKLNEQEKVENGIIIFEYYENEEEGTIGLPSTEEFNKKCEDFIRRVKEEIKFGGRLVKFNK